MMQNQLDLLLGLYIDLKIAFRPKLRMASLHVLAHHNERHEQYLNEVAHKEIRDKGRKWIERLPMQRRYLCSEDVVPAPRYSPNENHEKEAHRSDMVGYKDGEPVKPAHTFIMFFVDITDGL